MIDYNLILYCGIHRDLIKMDDEDLDRMTLLYKILLCFCCHLPQFHRSQVLQHQIKQLGMTTEKLKSKIYKFKNVLLT
jgi:hypothetical protein